jgi:hypothetical protein
MLPASPHTQAKRAIATHNTAITNVHNAAVVGTKRISTATATKTARPF